MNRRTDANPNTSEGGDGVTLQETQSKYNQRPTPPHETPSEKPDSELENLEAHIYEVGKLGGVKAEHHGYLCGSSIEDIQVLINSRIRKAVEDDRKSRS